MLINLKANLVGQDSYTSQKNGNTYHSIKLVDEKGDSIKVGVDESQKNFIEKQVKRFQEIDCLIDMVLEPYARLTLVTLK